MLAKCRTIEASTSKVHSDIAMRRIPVISIVFLILLALTEPQAGAQGAVVVRVFPATLTIPLAGTSDVAVEVVDVQGLYGFDLTLTFDAGVVEVVDANPNQPGVQVSFGTFLDPGLSVRNTADNTAGTVRYAMTQLNPSVAKNGTGNLIVIKFRGKSAGSTALVLSEVALASRDAAEIPSTKQPGQVTVGSSAGNLPTTTPIPTQAPPTPVPTAMPTQAPTQVQPSVTATDLPTAVSTATAVPPDATDVPSITSPTVAANTATPHAVASVMAATATPVEPAASVTSPPPQPTVQEVAALPATVAQPTAGVVAPVATSATSAQPEERQPASQTLAGGVLLRVGAGALGLAFILAVVIGIVLVIRRRSRPTS